MAAARRLCGAAVRGKHTLPATCAAEAHPRPPCARHLSQLVRSQLRATASPRWSNQ